VHPDRNEVEIIDGVLPSEQRRPYPAIDLAFLGQMLQLAIVKKRAGMEENRRRVAEDLEPGLTIFGDVLIGIRSGIEPVDMAVRRLQEKISKNRDPIQLGLRADPPTASPSGEPWRRARAQRAEPRVPAS